MAQTAKNAAWTPEGKRTFVRQMFASIAPTYDFMNSAMSLRLHHRWRREAVRLLAPPKGAAIGDVCAGTGDFAAPLRNRIGPEGRILALDFCEAMLKRSAGKPGGQIPCLADACRLPLRDGRLDGITVGWGLRNVPSLQDALAEAYRALATGGRFVSVDMAVPRSRVGRIASEIGFKRGVPLFGALLGKARAYRYLPESTQAFATREQLAEAMKRAGFRDVGWKDLALGNICIHYGTK
jgi:demethylmenaquinone methyltransferase/2-methoxy-6-polyprenyl-1,4-benzoquinol methylase